MLTLYFAVQVRVLSVYQALDEPRSCALNSRAAPSDPEAVHERTEGAQRREQ